MNIGDLVETMCEELLERDEGEQRQRESNAKARLYGFVGLTILVAILFSYSLPTPA